MKIVIFTDSYLPKIDGIAISVSGFCEELTKRGHEFLICAPAYPGTKKSETLNKIEILRFKNAPLPSYPDVKIVIPSRSKLRYAFKKFKPDVVHIQTPGLLGQYGLSLARLNRIPVVGTYHTMVNEMATYLNPFRILKVDKLLSRIMKQKKVKKKLPKLIKSNRKSLSNRMILSITNTLYERCKVIISPSQLIKNELLSHGVKKPIKVISNGLDLKQYARQAKQVADKTRPKFLHVGRISFEKNVEVVLKAFQIILKSIPQASLTIIGDGPAIESLKKETNNLNIDESVSFTGFIARYKLPETYVRYDLFLTASTMETQGLVVLEANASGLPVVGVDSYALPELIENNKNGFLVAPFDYEAMAKKSLKIINDSVLYESFSRHSIKIANAHEFQICADKVEALYRMVTSTPKK